MKNIIFILSVFLLFNYKLSNGQNIHKYPSYELVVRKFFNEYSIKEISPSARVNFEKKTTGWHITVIEYTPEEKKIKDNIFWSRDDNKFLKIDFEKAGSKEENAEELSRYIDGFLEGEYNKYLYYGYSGWDWDVIQELKDRENLNDSLLYCLGRAYSYYSDNLLNNNSGFSDVKHRFVLPEGKNCLTEEQLKTYRKYHYLAIETFKKLCDLNPNFETIVGNIKIKLYNEYLVSFLNISIYQNEEEARKELIDGLYDDFFISMAKNYLNSCAPNSILFTNGDSDTFPLLYVQSKLGIRKDVLVVNMSLLNACRYINHMRNKIFDASPLPISFTTEQIKDGVREYVTIINDSNLVGYVDIKRLIDFVKEDTNVVKNIDYKLFYFPTNKLLIKKNNDSIKWEISKNYVLRSHLILLDFLITNNWKRPVYFASTSGNDCFFGLNDYFQLEGLAYRLVSKKGNMQDNETGSVDASILYDNLMNKFSWNGCNQIISIEKLMSNEYKNIFYRLADDLIQKDEKEAALKVLDKCVEIFPNKVTYYDYYMIPVMQCYYRLEKYNKGNEIAEILINNFKNKLNNYNDSALGNDEYNKKIIEYFKETLKNYNQNELLKKAEILK